MNDLMIFGIFMFAAIAIMIVGVIAQSAAYRNGIADGWRAHGAPSDPLWVRKAKPTIDRYWSSGPDCWSNAEAFAKFGRMYCSKEWSKADVHDGTPRSRAGR